MSSHEVTAQRDCCSEAPSGAGWDSLGGVAGETRHRLWVRVGGLGRLRAMAGRQVGGLAVEAPSVEVGELLPVVLLVVLGVTDRRPHNVLGGLWVGFLRLWDPAGRWTRSTA